MEWLKRKVTRLAARWLQRQQGEEVEVGGGLEDHLTNLHSFIQESYKPVREAVEGISKQVSHLRDEVSSLKENLSENQTTAANLANTICGFKKELGEDRKAVTEDGKH